MYGLIAVVISIGIADSLNPTTVGPALILATGERPRRRVLEFTLGVVAVELAGGLAIVLGPGRLLVGLIPRPHHIASHIVECAVGLAMLVGAALLWRHRGRLTRVDHLSVRVQRLSGATLGAVIAALELPTAFPYFAAISAILVSHTGIVGKVLLVALFNLCFVFPLLVVAATLWLAGSHAEPMLARARRAMRHRWPRLLAGLALGAACVSLLVGVTGLLVAGHGPLGNGAKEVRHLFHLSPGP